MYFKLKEEAISIIKDGLKELNFEIPGEIKIDFPPNPDLGDLTTTISFVLAKKLRKPPIEIANQLSEVLKPSKSFIKILSVGPYINFYINYNTFSKKLLNYIDDDYGQLSNKNKKIVLEHTSANPNGPLHIGHLRNSLFGDALKRIFLLGGYDVLTQYYVNDMGRQIAIIVFGITKLELTLEDDLNIELDNKIDHKIGRLYYKANKATNENPEFNEEISNLIKEYESGNNPELNKTFEFVVEKCLEGVKETLNEINIRHDEFIWEGRFIREGKVNEIVDNLIDTGYTKENDVLYLDLLDDFGIEKELVLRRSDGTSLYSTRDLAYHVYKSKIADIIVDVLGSDHKLAVEQISIALELLKEKVPEVVFYEFINLPEGSMSTRRGVFISVDDLINEAIIRAQNELNKRRDDLSEDEILEIAKIIGIGAIRYYISKISPEKHITFKWDEALNFEKGCASIQYAYARGLKLLKKSDKFNLNADLEKSKILDLSINDVPENWIPNESEINLIRLFSKFPSIVEDSVNSRRVHQIAQYSLDLANSFNKFYKSEQVINNEFEIPRLILVEKAIFIIKKSLGLLGIEVPETM
ncbi:arginine--tRNA ligase [Methanobrevibacter curvatus]|uniref:Arginine--tRNA ligase n=1 Tax=Methanobrevibacter curvatus TaxID=49547 RepID=A0A166AW05_9EURY|nr:arginine--tRNA ligase [Methanobrevibacter curvatus]KZX12538.1 arginine--tRNA ligase [Methanobrevibacter curvatus]